MLRSVIFNNILLVLHQEEAYNPLRRKIPSEILLTGAYLIEYLHLKQACLEAPEFMLCLSVPDGTCRCISNILMSTSSMMEFLSPL